MWDSNRRNSQQQFLVEKTQPRLGQLTQEKSKDQGTIAGKRTKDLSPNNKPGEKHYSNIPLELEHV